MSDLIAPSPDLAQLTHPPKQVKLTLRPTLNDAEMERSILACTSAPAPAEASPTGARSMHTTAQTIPPEWRHDAPRPARLTTEELAAELRVQPQTIRAGLCRRGHYLGLRPAAKLANGRLLWSVSDLDALLAGESSHG